jgi:tRNA (mo5U34)-methyltransferase
LATQTANRLQRISDRYASKVSTPRPRATVTVVPGQEAAIEDLVWFHSLDLGGGVVTRGIKPADVLAKEAQGLTLGPDLSGKTALDIGAWDGYFSYELERRGAQVTSLDHYAWSSDRKVYDSYVVQAKAEGIVHAPPDESPAWDPIGLPGRAAFDLARKRLNSSVRPVVGDFMEMDLEPLGQFDIVLFLGVLYHLKDPFLALRRLRAVTRGTAVIETAGVTLPGWSQDKLWMFLESTELNDDASNWWAPTSAGLVSACQAAGFRDVQIINESPEYAAPNDGYDLHYGRITVHAYA